MILVRSRRKTGRRRKEGEHEPCDDAREAGIRARDDEESAEVLGADAHVRDVDREADEAVDEPGQDEWVALLDPVGPDGPDQERQGWNVRERCVSEWSAEMARRLERSSSRPG